MSGGRYDLVLMGLVWPVVVAESESEYVKVEEPSSHVVQATVPGGIPAGDPEEAH